MWYPCHRFATSRTYREPKNTSEVLKTNFLWILSCKKLKTIYGTLKINLRNKNLLNIGKETKYIWICIKVGFSNKIHVSEIRHCLLNSLKQNKLCEESFMDDINDVSNVNQTKARAVINIKHKIFVYTFYYSHVFTARSLINGFSGMGSWSPLVTGQFVNGHNVVCYFFMDVYILSRRNFECMYEKISENYKAENKYVEILRAEVSF